MFQQSEPFRAYMPNPVIDANFDIKYVSPELSSALGLLVRNGGATWADLLQVLGLSPDSPVLFDRSTIYVYPDRTDTSFNLRSRKEL